MNSSKNNAPQKNQQQNAQPTLEALSEATPTTSFAELNLADVVCLAVNEEGYETPTAVQAAAIPIVMSGRDLVACAQTGTGKTAAFALPILHALATGKWTQRQTQALVLAPTRELALQVTKNFKTYGKNLRFQVVTLYGGVSSFEQKRALKMRPEVIVATPGRLLDLSRQGCVDFKNVRTCVLDEADRMLDMGFIVDVRKILAMLPKERQTLLFSATMPKEVLELIHTFLRSPEKISVGPVAATRAQIEQFAYAVPRAQKRDLLLHLIDTHGVSRGIVFTRTKAAADKVAYFLRQSGLKADAIHGDKSQAQRQRAIEYLRRGTITMLVASDIASRGIDIDNVSHVINYDIPNEPETYVHRIGRTGRAEAAGVAFSLVDAEERKFFSDIERLIQKKIPLKTEHPFRGQEGEARPHKSGFPKREANPRRFPKKPWHRHGAGGKFRSSLQRSGARAMSKNAPG